MSDSVKPILDAGLADLVEADHKLTSESCSSRRTDTPPARQRAHLLGRRGAVIPAT